MMIDSVALMISTLIKNSFLVHLHPLDHLAGQWAAKLSMVLMSLLGMADTTLGTRQDHSVQLLLGTRSFKFSSSEEFLSGSSPVTPMTFETIVANLDVLM